MRFVMPNIGSRGTDLQKGEQITLFASAARLVTAGVNGDTVYVGGERIGYIFYLDVTAAATVAGDILDVFIDWSLNGTRWFNGARFTRVLGNGGAVSFYTSFVVQGETADVALTANAAINTTRGTMLAPYVRGRYIVTQAGADVASFTFSLIGYAI